MFIGHLPAGYVANDMLQRTCWRGLDAAERRLTTRVMLIASLAPDFDLIYFYLFDGRGHNHHSYWPHVPVVWLGIGAVLAVAGFLLKSRRLLLANVALMIAIFLHLVLDTIVGGIAWWWPWSERLVVWIELPALHRPWYWNFFLHWTFLLEIAVILTAALIWIRRRRDSRSRSLESRV